MQIVDTGDTQMWIKDGILYCIHMSNELTLKIAKKSVSERITLCDGKTYPFLADFSKLRKTSRSARKYLTQGESQKFLNAGAFIVKTPIEKFIINFWLKIDRPILPAKFFNNENDALTWLEKYKLIN